MAKRPTDVVLLSLRIREEMRRRLAQAAKKRNASVNQEIVKRLEASFAPAAVINLDKVAADIEQATANLKSLISRETWSQGLKREPSFFVAEQVRQLLRQAAKALNEERSDENVERLQRTVEMILQQEQQRNE